MVLEAPKIPGGHGRSPVTSPENPKRGLSRQLRTSRASEVPVERPPPAGRPRMPQADAVDISVLIHHERWKFL